MALLHVHHYSKALRMNMDMEVILPEKAKGQIGLESRGGQGACRVLYLLHGLSDDHTIWLRRTSIERYASRYHLAVIMPGTHRGFYTDMAYGFKYFTYLTKELPVLCGRMFPQISRDRQDTFAAGLSMGGYGALKCALRAPETFSKAAALSAVTDVARMAREHPNPLLKDVFGTPGKVENSFNDLFAAASQMAPEERPPLYIWCGTEDFLYQDNLRLRDHLRGLGYALTYEESPGGHTWDCWDRKIQDALEWLMGDI